MTLPRLLLVLALVPGICAAQSNAQDFRLENGLRLIVKEDHRAPTAVQQVWYRVGGVDEEVGATGVAHVLEHMMFKGTKRYKAGEFSRLVTEAGGRDNAFTSKDYTVYFQQVHKDRLPLVMQLEADRMANLILRESDFKQEIRVVMEERRWRYEDRPHALVYENWMAAAFVSHPYHWPGIGWMEDLEKMTWRDARSWYERWYAPNNATVVIVGDVDARQVLALARRYYGAVPTKAVPAKRTIAEPPQRGPRRVVVKAPAELPYLRLGYKAPALRDAAKDSEPYAIALLAEILGGSDAARLQRVLVRERRLATSVSADYDLLARGPGSLSFEAGAAPGKSAAELEAALREALGRLVADGISVDELDRAKARQVAQEVYKRDSLFAQAMELGTLESVGLSFRDVDRILERLRRVTADEVVAAAKKYMTDEGLTVAVLDPQPLASRPQRSAPPPTPHR
jgi:zinc protease